MSRTDALVAVLNAARALKASTQLPVPAEPRGVIVSAPLLAAVFAAVDVVDDAGLGEPHLESTASEVASAWRDRARRHLQTYHGGACAWFDEPLPLPDDLAESESPVQADRRTQAPCGVCTTIAWVEGPAGLWCAYCALVSDLGQLARGQPVTPRVDATRDRPGFCQGDPECWRTVEVGQTCYQHSAIAAKPHPFEQARLRDRALGGVGDGE